MILQSIVTAFLFFLPAGVANATPVVANKIPLLNRWNTPIDFGRYYHGKRVLGPNKRWRGVLAAAFAAGLTGLLVALWRDQHWSLSSFLLAALMGFGAIMGDAVESFFKRQRGVPAGQKWVPFDQIDYIMGGLVIIYPFTHLSLRIMLLIFVTYFGLHLLVAYLAYLLGLKDSPI